MSERSSQKLETVYAHSSETFPRFEMMVLTYLSQLRLLLVLLVFRKLECLKFLFCRDRLSFLLWCCIMYRLLARLTCHNCEVNPFLLLSCFVYNEVTMSSVTLLYMFVLAVPSSCPLSLSPPQPACLQYTALIVYVTTYKKWFLLVSCLPHLISVELRPSVPFALLWPVQSFVY
jgi:hypothetical protein